MSSADVHHTAFRLAETVALCGSNETPELSLNPDRITCPECRRIVGLPPREDQP